MRKLWVQILALGCFFGAFFNGSSAQASYPQEVCGRSPEIRREIEQRLEKSCEKITPTDLRTISEIVVDDDLYEDFTELRSGDFAGLTSLTKLVLFGNF